MFKTKNKTKEPESFDKAYDYSIHILGISLRTVAEMKQKLKEKGFSETVISKIINDFVERKYLNDQSYAKVFLDNLKKYKNFGFYGIKKKLMEKRLPAEIIERTLYEGMSTYDELAIARRFLKKHSTADKNKNAQRLKSRGFRGEVIGKLIFDSSD